MRLRGLFGALAIFAGDPALATSILIEDVTVIDGSGSAPMPHMYVVIDDDRITLLADHEIAPTTAARRIEGNAKFLIRGLVDTHVHLRCGADTPTDFDNAMGIGSGIKSSVIIDRRSLFLAGAISP